MIQIARLTSGALLIQHDATEIVIDAAALPHALPSVLLTLTESSKAIGQARKEGYENGLVVGHANGTRETEARYRREAEELAESAYLIRVSAPLAA